MVHRTVRVQGGTYQSVTDEQTDEPEQNAQTSKRQSGQNIPADACVVRLCIIYLNSNAVFGVFCVLVLFYVNDKRETITGT